MANDRKSSVPLPGRVYGSTPERLAGLETTMDVVRVDVQGLSDGVDTIKDELGDLKTSQSVQTHKLSVIEDQVSTVQSSMGSMETKILSSVQNFLKVAKSTSELDADLALTAKLFSRERMTEYKKIGGIIAAIVMFIYGFIQYAGVAGSVWNQPVKQETIDHLKSK